jgi:hypothetical protein
MDKKERILKAAREKCQVIYRGKPMGKFEIQERQF